MGIQVDMPTMSALPNDVSALPPHPPTDPLSSLKNRPLLLSTIVKQTSNRDYFTVPVIIFTRKFETGVVHIPPPSLKNGWLRQCADSYLSVSTFSVCNANFDVEDGVLHAGHPEGGDGHPGPADCRGSHAQRAGR